MCLRDGGGDVGDGPGLPGGPNLITRAHGSREPSLAESRRDAAERKVGEIPGLTGIWHAFIGSEI